MPAPAAGPLTDGAERAAGAGDDQTAHRGLVFVDGVERFGKTAEHVERHRIHHLLVVELQDGHRAIELQRDMVELHRFPRKWWPALFRAAVQRVLLSPPYLIFSARLSMVVTGTLACRRTRGQRAPNPTGNAHEHF
jgi:hypothetical protein